MCNNAVMKWRKRKPTFPALLFLQSMHTELEGSAGSQWRHVVLPVTSSATPLTKEGNKHPHRRNGRGRERGRKVGGRGRET